MRGMGRRPGRPYQPPTSHWPFKPRLSKLDRFQQLCVIFVWLLMIAFMVYVVVHTVIFWEVAR